MKRFCYLNQVIWFAVSILLIGLFDVRGAAADGIQNRTFIAISLDKPLADLFYKLNGKSVKVSIPPFSASIKYVLPPGDSVIFYRTSSGGSADKSASYQDIKVAEAKFSDSTQSYILFFGPERAGVCQVMGLPDSEKVLPYGSARLVNFSALEIAAKCNKEVAVLAPGQTKLVEGNGNDLEVHLALRRNNEWLEAFNSNYLHSKTTRLNIIMLKSASDYFQSRLPGAVAIEPGPIQVFSIVEEKNQTSPDGSG